MEAETCKRELVIQIPYDVVLKESESVAAKFARKAHVPGFRPGRVPREFVLQRFKKAIREEVAMHLLPEFFGKAVKEQNLSLAGEPVFDELKFEENEPLTAKASFEVLPSFELGSTMGLEVTEEVEEVAEADVDRAVERVREDASTFEVVEDRPADDGDVLSVSYAGHDTKGSRAPIFEVKDGLVRLGEESTVPEFTSNLRGVRAGDVRDFEVAYRENFPEPKVAGKTVKFRVTVLAVKRKVTPPADDELAKTTGNSATLEELRASLRKELESQRKRKAELETKRKLLDLLGARQTFPVPDVMVSDRLERRLRAVAGDLFDQGIDPRHAGIDWPKMRQEMREEATRDVRDSLILEKVADELKLDVSEEEIDDAVRGLAAGGNETPAALKTRLTQSGGLARLQSSRRNQKALDALYHSAEIIRSPNREDPSPPPGAGEQHEQK